jgi:cytochrome c biogenesis factor
MIINDKNEQRLFRFHPTRIVTGKLFNSILNDISVNIQRCYLYTGYSGISKSVAVMLLTLLSNNIA